MTNSPHRVYQAAEYVCTHQWRSSFHSVDASYVCFNSPTVADPQLLPGCGSSDSSIEINVLEVKTVSHAYKMLVQPVLSFVSDNTTGDAHMDLISITSNEGPSRRVLGLQVESLFRLSRNNWPGTPRTTHSGQDLCVDRPVVVSHTLYSAQSGAFVLWCFRGKWRSLFDSQTDVFTTVSERHRLQCFIHRSQIARCWAQMQCHNVPAGGQGMLAAGQGQIAEAAKHDSLSPELRNAPASHVK